MIRSTLTPVLYAPPDRDGVIGQLRNGTMVTAGDIERLSLAALAHEVARRAEAALAAGEDARCTALRLAANSLRTVAGLPPFAWPAAGEVDAPWARGG